MWAFFCLLVLAGPLWAGERRVAVLLSREIAPYVAMVEGLEAQLKVPVDRFFIDEQGKPYGLGGRPLTGGDPPYAALVAVGPEALVQLAGLAGVTPLAYGMVLNPEQIAIPAQGPRCGTSLNLPAAVQFAAIRRELPGLTRLGVLFDPANNQEWFAAALPVAAAQGITLAPVNFRRSDGRLELTGDLSRLGALLFIPDKTVVAKTVIQHVIKQGVLQRVPVVGYNRFFHDSGAAISLVIDYREVGAQVGRQVEGLLAGGSCEPAAAPPFTTLINREVWRALGLSPPPGREGGGR